MTADELIEGTLGEVGMRAHAALHRMFTEKQEMQACGEVRDMLKGFADLDDGQKLMITLNRAQATVLATYYSSGVKLLVRINDALEKEEQDDSQAEA